MGGIAEGVTGGVDVGTDGEEGNEGALNVWREGVRGGTGGVPSSRDVDKVGLAGREAVRICEVELVKRA